MTGPDDDLPEPAVPQIGTVPEPTAPAREPDAENPSALPPADATPPAEVSVAPQPEEKKKEEDLPSVDDLIPRTKDEDLPSVDDLIPQDVDREQFRRSNNMNYLTDLILSRDGPVGAVVDKAGAVAGAAAGVFSQPFMIDSPEARDVMKKAGVLPDYEKGYYTVMDATMDALVRPAVQSFAYALESFLRIWPAAQAAAKATGSDLGAGVAEIMDDPLIGLHGTAPHGTIPAAIQHAVERPAAVFPAVKEVLGAYGNVGRGTVEFLKGVGRSEEAWKNDKFDDPPPKPTPGSEYIPPPGPVGHQQAGPVDVRGPGERSPIEVTFPRTGEVSAPIIVPNDVHSAARAAAPEVFAGEEGYDALTARRDTQRRMVDEARTARNQQAIEEAPHGPEIANLETRIADPDTTPRLRKKYQARLAPLIEERESYLKDATEGDSEDMAAARRRVMETDEKMRDLAPGVSKAYQKAREQFPAPAEPEPGPRAAEPAEFTPPAGAEPGTPEHEAAFDEFIGAQEGPTKALEPAAAPAAAPRPTAEQVLEHPLEPGKKLSIADDVAAQAMASGVPEAEARAVGEAHQDYWETRSKLFKGKKGTPEEMYAKESPFVRPAPGVKAVRPAPVGAAEPIPGPIGNTVVAVSPGEIAVDPKRFQFKAGGDEAGATDRLKGVDKWDPVKGGMILAWRDEAGKLWLVDGHQRHALATRAAKNQPVRLNAWVLDARDGTTDVQARTIAAAKNIAEGTGTAVDAAKVLRDNPALMADLPPRSELVIQARGLANLDPVAFGAVVNDVIPPNHGAIVGRLIPKDPALQNAVINLLAKAHPANLVEAEAIVRQAREAGASKVKEAAQGDLFGAQDTSHYVERARVLDGAVKELKRDRRVFDALNTNKAAIESAGNKLAGDVNVQRAQADAQAIQVIQTLAARTGPIADALNAAARSARASGRYPDAVRDFVAAIRERSQTGDLARLADGERRSGKLADAEGAAGASGRPDAVEKANEQTLELFQRDEPQEMTPAKGAAVYHGSSAKFSRPSLSRATSNTNVAKNGYGVHFSESRDLALGYGDNLYSANLKHDRGEFLDLTKPLSEQPESVKSWADSLGLPKSTSAKTLETIVRNPEYHTSELPFSDAKGAAKSLLDHGVPGTSYEEKGARGYAIFDPRKSVSDFGSQSHEMVQAPDTPAFKNWFGDSKVVDEAGQPLVVYHGTAEDISAFKRGPSIRYGHGRQMDAIYFSPDDKVAQAYSRTAVSAKDASRDEVGNVVPVYLSLKNPKEFSSVSEFANASRADLESQGFDGAIRRNNEGKVVELAAFKPDQIKSATGNRGTFDPNSNEIFNQVPSDHAPNGWDVVEPAPREEEPVRQGDARYRVGPTSYIHYRPTELMSDHELELKQAVDKVFQRMFPTADYAAVPHVEVGGHQAHGVWSPTGNPEFPSFIAVSMRSNNVTATARHEGLHMLIHEGFLTDEELSVLEQASREGDWRKEHSIESRYHSKADWIKTEESIAEAFGKYQSGRLTLSDPVEKIFQKIQDLYDRVAAAVREVFGNVTYEDIFKRIERGEVGRRTPDRSHLQSRMEPMFEMPDRTFREDGGKVDRSLSDLETTIPLSVRRAGKYVSGEGTKTVGGEKWRDKDLTKPGAGANFRQEDLNRIFKEAIDSVHAPPDRIEKFMREHPKFSPNTEEFWDKSLSLPDRARFWYEVSSEAFKDAFKGTKEQLAQFFDLVAATSAQANPTQNLQRAIGSLSEHRQGLPIKTDLMDPVWVRQALAPGGIPGLKTGSFSQTFSHIIGMEDQPPLSVNDRQVASTFGISGEDLGAEPWLYEALSKFYTKLRDLQNDHPDVKAGKADPYETWQLQALGWVEERARKVAEKGKVEGYDDYAMVMDRLSKSLEAAGVDTSEGILSDKVLMDPRTPNVMSGTRKHYVDPKVATLETATTNTKTGAAAHLLNTKLEQLGSTAGWRGKAADDFVRVQRRAMASLSTRVKGDSSIIEKLFAAVAGRKVGVTRIDTDGYGTFNGVVSPNMRIPLIGRTSQGFWDLGDESTRPARRAILAALGEDLNQEASAASRFKVLEDGDPNTKTFTVFVHGFDKGIDPAKVSAMERDIGHPLNVHQTPNGTVIDINVGGADKFPVKQDVENAADKHFPDSEWTLFHRDYDGEYLDKSEYKVAINGFWKAVRNAGKDRDAGGLGQAGVTPGDRDGWERAREEIQAIAKERDAAYAKWTSTYGERIEREHAKLNELYQEDESEPATGAEARGLQERGGLSGSEGRMAAQSAAPETLGPTEPLHDLPTRVKIPGQGTISVGPHPPARAAAEDYMRSAQLPYDPPTTYVKVDPEVAGRIARAFEEMKDDPNDPDTKAAYAAMAKETMAQWQAIKKTGLKVDFIDGPDPYAASPRLAIEDIRNNNHMSVFSTEDGFGSAISDEQRAAHPLLADSGETISGRPALLNDIFRIVHDYFGHAKEGVGFRADGEENAWRSHASMYSPLARRAMTTETRGQNSWLNYGPHGEANRAARTADTVFAEQKVGLLPEWASEEGRRDDLHQQSPPFYLASDRALNDIQQNKAQPEQWAAMLRNAGVSPKESGFLGLDEWLKEQKGPVTKDQVRDFIRANSIEIKEITKHGGNVDNEGDIVDTPSGDTAKFANYQLSGGTNYKEMLLQLPPGERVTRFEVVGKNRDIIGRFESREEADEWAASRNKQIRGVGATVREREMRSPTDYKSSHWDESNVLAHIRMSDRTIDGKRTLLLEEVQSDWHQAGRKYGYKDGKGLTTRKMEGNQFGENVHEAVTSDGTVVGRGFSPEDALNAAKGMPSVPDAPFKTSWPELVMKRMIRFAAENGYDKVAWTPGDVQAERYDLSKKIEKIRYNPDTGHLVATPLGEGEAIDQHVPPDKLSDVIGKDAADRVINNPTKKINGKKALGQDGTYNELTGVDLKIGGEGMRAFYDKMLPNVVNKLVKKYGAKVGEGGIEQDDFSEDAFQRWRKKVGAEDVDDEDARDTFQNGIGDREKTTQSVHTLDLTPQLKETAIDRGFSMFQGGNNADTIKRGKIRLRPNGQRNTMTMFAERNASTMIHETAHDWLDRLLKDFLDKDAPSSLKADGQTVLDWFGVDHPDKVTTAHHERFARAFERYFAEGRAPSKGLVKVFEQFKEWMSKLYDNARRLNYPISEEVRGVFDRMLAVNPERATITPEAEPHASMADRHEAHADNPIEGRERDTANAAQMERDSVAATHAPEDNDGRLGGIEAGAERRAPGGPQLDRNGNGPQALTGEEGIAPQPAQVGEGGGAAPPSRDQDLPPGPPVKKTEAPSGTDEPFDKAGNIRLENTPLQGIKDPDLFREYVRQSAARNNNFTAERRGVVSDIDAMKVAQILGKDPSFIDKKQIGEAWTKEEIFAIEVLFNKSTAELRDFAEKAKSGNIDDVIAYETKVAQLQMWSDAVTAKASAARAESGRSLQAYAALAKMSQRMEGTDAGKLLKQITGRTLYQAQRAAKFTAGLNTPGQVSLFANALADRSTRGAIIEWYINALISGPVTHMRYAVGNEIKSLAVPLLELPVAATAGYVREFTGRPQAEGDRVYFGEIPAQLYGFLAGHKKGLSVAIDAFVNGFSAPLPGEQVSAHFLTPQKNIPGPIGEAIRVPSRSVAAIHSFAKTVNYERNLHGLAYRTAANEGLVGQAFDNRVAALLVRPTSTMMDLAVKDSLREVFMSTPDYNSFQASAARLFNNNLALKVVAPFMKIGMQITSEALMQRTPIGPAAGAISELTGGEGNEVFKNLAMQGAGPTGKGAGAAFDMQVAKQVTGMALIGGTIALTLEGVCNGDGPEEPSKRAVWMLAHRPNTCTFGDLQIPYQGLAAYGMIIRLAANMTHTAEGWNDEDGAKLALHFFEGVTKSVLDENFMRGVKDFLDAMYHPQEYLPNYIKQFATNWLPFSVGGGQVARMVDPFQRDTKDIISAAQAKVPWLSERLMPRVDMFGEPIPNSASEAIARYKDDPVVKTLNDLQIGIAPMKREIRGVDLTDEQFFTLQTMAGRMAKEILDGFVGGPGWDDLPAETRINMVHTAVSQARDNARNIVAFDNAEQIMFPAYENKVGKQTGQIPVNQKPKQPETDAEKHAWWRLGR